MELPGTASDDLPDVLATGRGDTAFAFVSLSARHPEGRDADYIAWHSLDHRPEQYRLEGLRNALRFVSTPECRAVRAAAEGGFDAVDHVMTYWFTGPASLPAFNALGGALDRGGRMSIRLPSQGYLTGARAGLLADPAAVAGADVLPWRPARGMYLLVEEGSASPEGLLDVDGVAGMWWFDGDLASDPGSAGGPGKRFTILFLEGDPVATGKAIGERLPARWEGGSVKGLFAAPFFAVVPFEWDRYLP